MYDSLLFSVFILQLSPLPKELRTIILTITWKFLKPSLLYPILTKFKNNYTHQKTLNFEGIKFEEDLRSLIIGKDKIYISDFLGHRVYIFGLDKLQLLATLGTKHKGSQEGEFDRPWGMALDEEFNLLVSDYGNSRLQVFDPQHRFIRSIQIGYFPSSVGILRSGDLVVIHDIDPSDNCISCYSRDGEQIQKEDRKKLSPRLTYGNAIAVDNEDSLHIADWGNHKMLKINRDGEATMRVDYTGPNERPLFRLYSVLVDMEGNFVVGDEHGVNLFSASGNFLSRFQGFGFIQRMVKGMTFDETGNIYVAHGNKIEFFS